MPAPKFAALIALALPLLATPTSAAAATANIQTGFYSVPGASGQFWLKADDGVSDVRIEVRDKAVDGYCGRAQVRWVLAGGVVKASPVVEECDDAPGVRFWVKPAGEPAAPVLGDVINVDTYLWSGPKAQPVFLTSAFCSRQDVAPGICPYYFDRYVPSTDPKPDPNPGPKP